jgi:putative transposon-encoded protein
MGKIPWLLILLFSCKSPASTGGQVTLESIAAEKLGENAVIKKNSDLTFALFSSQSYSFRELCAYEQLIILIDFFFLRRVTRFENSAHMNFFLRRVTRFENSAHMNNLLF